MTALRQEKFAIARRARALEERDSGFVGFGTFILHPAFANLPV